MQGKVWKGAGMAGSSSCGRARPTAMGFCFRQKNLLGTAPGRRLEELEEELRAASAKFEADLAEASLALGSPGLCQLCGPV